VPPFLHGDGKH
jgi:hypothetical protein